MLGGEKYSKRKNSAWQIIVPGHAWIFFRIIELIGLLSGVSTKTKPECQLFVIRSKSWMFRKRLGKCADLLTHAKDRNRGKHIWSLASGTHFSKRSLFPSACEPSYGKLLVIQWTRKARGICIFGFSIFFLWRCSYFEVVLLAQGNTDTCSLLGRAPLISSSSAKTHQDIICHW